MSKRILWIHFNPQRKMPHFKWTLYLREYGRLKVKACLNIMFYTGKHQTIKDVKKNRKGILKRLMDYED